MFENRKGIKNYRKCTELFDMDRNGKKWFKMVEKYTKFEELLNEHRACSASLFSQELIHI